MNFDLLISDLLKRDFEESWFEFKVNWFEPNELGEYISALSNSATFSKAKYGYLIWGIDDKTHEVVGTDFNYHRDVSNEPLEHFLLRYLTPRITIEFKELIFNGKRLIVLRIPQAINVPTSYKKERYIRIGSSKENLNKYMELESRLIGMLNYKDSSISSIESEYQDLTFNSLITYYATKGITLNLETYKGNLGLLTNNGSYNLLAQILSDNSHISIRVGIFAGLTKADPMYSVREYGNMCLLLSLDKLLDFGDTFNIPQADERNRIVERKEISLFDSSAYREAVINAFIHNDWSSQNAPMFTFYCDRIEILSNGSLSPKLTINEFYKGKSEPVNRRLSDIFMQLHISERTGRGVPVIYKAYGKEAFQFSTNYIQVTIPFFFIGAVDYQVRENLTFNSKFESNNKLNHHLPKELLNKTQINIISKMIKNPFITKYKLSKLLLIGQTTIQKNLKLLKEYEIIKRVGSNKTGYWEVIVKN